MLGTTSLLCYTRKPTRREEANNADIALSMHLALRSHVSGDWMPLNENYGIFFAAGVPSAACSHADGAPAGDARAACVAAARLGVDPYDDGREASPAVAYGAVMPEVDIVLKSLRDPYLFRLADGGFGIVATRTARGGDPDGSERSSFLLAISRDLTDFEQLGQVVLDTDAGVNKPRVEFDQNAGEYRIRWRSDDGVARLAMVDDITAAAGHTLAVADDTESPDAETVGLGPVDACTDDLDAYGIADVVPGNSIAITQQEAHALIARFGRVYNTGASVRPYTMQSSLRGDEARDAVAGLRNVRAELAYSDGSTAMRAVDWDADEIGRLADDLADGRLVAGERRAIHGRVRQTIYPVPFAVERADPSVFAWNWNGEPLFLFIATEDEDGNCIDPRGGHTHMPLRVASSIAELSDAAGGREREVDLLVRGDLNSEGRAMTGCFWAPELHVIDGRLSILFMPCFDGPDANPDGSANDRAGKPDMWTGSCHIMQLKQDADGRDLDPREPGNWTVPEPILGAAGETLNPVQRISLDMTVIADSGRWYYAWQQVGSVWIASFDPKRPNRLTSTPRQIIVPEYAWDNAIAEGPNAVVHDGRIFLIYSGSLVGIDYTTGLVTAPAGENADLLDPATWTKLAYPLQKSGVYNGEWQLGTGHGMWSHDEDGNLIYVFHNAECEEGRYGGRDAQVRRVHWSAEGMPILDMQSAEELHPDYACITMNITLL
ncbi:family 43 glycosylhydrolase [Bifidobacterium eulemuris]|uniref:Alpha-arabinofuranosidase n=1 Tax=Bifidobacterium eulemuris TaxID=1765219 RepID=A0A261G168_9BIFI|nr:family 43 glycosylhydrolase [Bifidobacterium eulemuris]OZG64736.1 alpha-arabinofuranosidase [Bifidobacterium eulemuris]QOL32481.1 family 43 glycosylhydrolase [Bifidobacterium eulemuris]